jgi:hypothetical protein
MVSVLEMIRIVVKVKMNFGISITNHLAFETRLGKRKVDSRVVMDDMRLGKWIRRAKCEKRDMRQSEEAFRV